MRRASALLIVSVLVSGCAGGKGGSKEAGKVQPPTSASSTTAPPAETTSSTGSSTGGQPSSSAPPTTATTRRRVTSPPKVTVPTGASTTTTSKPATTKTLADVKLRLTKVATLDQPLDLAQRAGDDAFYVAEKRGRVRVVRAGFVQPDPVLDLSSEVTTTGAEQGLLGITFSPDGNFLYVAFNNRSGGDCTLWEYAFHDGMADISTKRELLSVDHSEFSNHNGGHITFGPDGMLYYGLGDGGSGNDPHNNAQNLNVLLGKILRIDPKPSGSLPYTIPSDNPFAGRSDARGEIWEYGLRNPWRWSFDRLTKDFWIGDVGQNTSEEIDFLPRDIAPGANLGWSAFEGSQRTPGKVGATEPANPVPPVYEYPTHDGCAVTGGYVYRGAKIPALQGAYVFGDYCNGTVQGLLMDGRKVVEHRALGLVAEQLASFGEDRDGELYVLSLAGTLYRIDPA